MTAPFVNIHTHSRPINPNIVSIYNHYKVEPTIASFISAGLHPWYLPDSEQEALDFLQHFHAQTNFVALGEIGLDKVCDTALAKQLHYFKLCLQFAVDNHIKVIILHCVKAHNEILSCLKESQFHGHVIWHDFHASPTQLDQILEIPKHLISLGRVIFRSNSKLYSTIKSIPLDKVFLETDDNEISIDEQYLQFSKLTDRAIDKVKESIFNNYQSVFGTL